jgi:hypothetical protein
MFAVSPLMDICLSKLHIAFDCCIPVRPVHACNNTKVEKCFDKIQNVHAE